MNDSFAKRLFPGASALGQILLRGLDADIKHEIVGVIRDVRTNGLNAPATDEIYFPMRQLGRGGMAVVARTNTDPNVLQAVIRSAVAGVDKDQPISFFRTMDANIAQSLGVQRIVASLTAIFAAVALVLSAVGLYSVLAYAVAQRSPSTLVSTGGVAVLFALVALFACLLPSLRASRIDPLAALRGGLKLDAALVHVSRFWESHIPQTSRSPSIAGISGGRHNF